MDPEHAINVQKVVQGIKAVSASNTTDIGEENRAPGANVALPPTTEMAKTLEDIKTRQLSSLPKESLSPTGETLRQDVSQTIEHAEELLVEKNRDECVQQAWAEINAIVKLQDTDAGRSLKEKLVEANREWVDWGEAGSKSLELARNLIGSDSFRSFVRDITNIFQELLNIGIEKVTEQRPEETRSQDVQSQLEGTETEDTKMERAREEKDHLLDRLMDVVVQVKERKEYQDILDATPFGWFRSIPEVESLNLEAGERETLNAMQLHGKHAAGHLLKLFENFANSPMDDLVVAWKELQSRLANDEQAQAFFQDAQAFAKRCARDTEYEKEQIRSDASDLVDRYRNVREEYRPRLQHFFSLLRYYLDRMSRDPLTCQLSDDVTKLTRDLFFDEAGNATFKPELLGDLRQIIPAILRNLRYLKVPDIEVHEPGLDFVATNIIINVSELVPHHLRLTLSSDIPEKAGELTQNLIDFEIYRLHAQAKDICFTIAKTGLPPLNDSGLADIRVFDEGMHLGIRLEPVSSGGDQPTAGLRVARCVCQLENFDLSVHGSGHDWMYYLLGPYIRRLVKERIEESVVKFFITTNLMTPVPAGSSQEHASQSTTVPASQPSQRSSQFAHA